MLTLSREPDDAEVALFRPEWSTARLDFSRPDTMRDGAPMFRGWAQDPEVSRYLLWTPHSGVDETYLFLARCEHAWREHVGHRPWSIRAGGQLIGMLGVDYFEHRLVVGYVLTRSAWGQGYLTEALSAFSEHALAVPGITRIEAHVHPDNPASGRVLGKCGYVVEGRLRRHTVFPNVSERPSDVDLFARISTGDW
ncbi:MAG: GNAT family N-acetyltransferase [Myxococcales bacterium]|nr:GNAT family N-acetyltransferase [Myxococcales bacterium]